jgi:hypothetical protein
MRYRYLDDLISALTKLRDKYGNMPVSGGYYFPYGEEKDLYVPTGIELEVDDTYVSRYEKAKQLNIVTEEG